MKNKQFTGEDQDVLEQIIQLRRDVRGNHFIDKPISDDVIERILSAAVSAPSVGYSQPWEPQFDQQESLYSQLKLEGISESPVNIAVFYKPSSEPVLGQTSMPDMGEYSVVCAIQNMWLMARALNVGVGWVSILNPDSVKQILDVPESSKLVAYLCIGYVDEFSDKPELEVLKWADRKEQHTLVHYESYKET